MKHCIILILISCIVFFFGCENALSDSNNQNQTDVYGCTDPDAVNYNSEATIDDGSCEYETQPASLSNTWGNNPNETSSPIIINGTVKNNGGTTASNVTASITINYLCNQGFANGIPGNHNYQTKYLGSISPNQTTTYSTESYDPGCHIAAYQILPSIHLSYE